MAKNITLMGASYSDVPAVQLPQTGGGTARFDDCSVVTATASDVAQGKVFVASDGTVTTGTASGGGGVDMPTFTVVMGNSGITSITCDKSYSDVSQKVFIDNNGMAMLLVQYDGGEVLNGISVYDVDSDMQWIRYLVFGAGGNSFDMTYHSDNTITWAMPSSYYENLNITENGTYQATDYLNIINNVNVNVPQPSGSINITQNGTVDVTNYASAVVNVSGGGSSAWTKVAETSYQVSTTSTSAATVATWATGHSELWTADKWVYVRIRDTAGLRDGYFFGSDQFFYNSSLANGSSPTYISTILRICTRYSNSTITPAASISTGAKGVYADYLYSDGRIRIRKSYNSSSSLTIDGTYKVEVYLLDPAGGVPIFE